MLKRLVGVICVRNGWAVQSIGYNRYLPIGRPEIVAENLDRWFLDEIFVICIDRTAQQLGPDFDTLEKISQRALMTPLAYGGGISNAEQAAKLIKLGADRIGLESIFAKDVLACREIREAVGVQAIIRALPIEFGPDKTLLSYDYISGKVRKFDVATLGDGHDPLFSELMVIDRKNDGGASSFDFELLSQFANLPHQIIAFGGITTKFQVNKLFSNPLVSAVGIGNSLNYRELANRDLTNSSDMDDTRKTSHGTETRGARQW